MISICVMYSLRMSSSFMRTIVSYMRGMSSPVRGADDASDSMISA
jgi:hypothetical protein